MISTIVSLQKRLIAGLVVGLFLLPQSLCSSKSKELSNMDILDVTCNSDCKKIAFIARSANDIKQSFVFDRDVGTLNNVHIGPTEFDYLFFSTAGSLYGSVGSKAYALDIENKHSQVIFENESVILSPTVVKNYLYFSSPSMYVFEAKNSLQRRKLYRLDLNTGILENLLGNIISYQVGRPYFINDRNFIIDLIMPEYDRVNTEDYVTSEFIKSLKNSYIFWFDIEKIKNKISKEDILNSRILGGNWQNIEKGSAGANSRYIAIYNYFDRATWMIIDTSTGQPIGSFDAKSTRFLLIVPNGKAALAMSQKGDTVFISVFDLPNLSRTSYTAIHLGSSNALHL